VRRCADARLYQTAAEKPLSERGGGARWASPVLICGYWSPICRHSVRAPCARWRYSSRQLDRGVQLVPIGEADEPGTLAADDLVATDDDPEMALLPRCGERQGRGLISPLAGARREARSPPGP